MVRFKSSLKMKDAMTEMFQNIPLGKLSFNKFIKKKFSAYNQQSILWKASKLINLEALYSIRINFCGEMQKLYVTSAKFKKKHMWHWFSCIFLRKGSFQFENTATLSYQISVKSLDKAKEVKWEHFWTIKTMKPGYTHFIFLSKWRRKCFSRHFFKTYSQIDF